jgi:nucleotide-binding universal stress UspA family protein
MKILLPVDSSLAALAPIAHIESMSRSGAEVEILILNVQPRFHRRIAQFTTRAARDELRAERSRSAMARAAERLSLSGLRFRAASALGTPAERIAAVAEREEVNEIMMGVGRHSAWLRWLDPSVAQGVMARTDIPVTVFARGRPGAFERYAVPAGLAGLTALLLSAE